MKLKLLSSVAAASAQGLMEPIPLSSSPGCCILLVGKDVPIQEAVDMMERGIPDGVTVATVNPDEIQNTVEAFVSSISQSGSRIFVVESSGSVKDLEQLIQQCIEKYEAYEAPAKEWWRSEAPKPEEVQEPFTIRALQFDKTEAVYYPTRKVPHWERHNTRPFYAGVPRRRRK